MSVFDIKKSSAWNYSNESRPNYSESLEGVVVGMDNPQARDFQSGKKKFFNDGNPMRNIRVFISTGEGEKSVTFRPGSALYDAFVSAIGDAGLGGFADIIAHDVRIDTKAGAYSMAHPRPWKVLIGTNEVKGVKLHKVPVIDYDTIDPVSGKAKEDSDIPF